MCEVIGKLFAWVLFQDMLPDLCLHQCPFLLLFLTPRYIDVVLFGLWKGCQESVKDPKEHVRLKVGQVLSKASECFPELQHNNDGIRFRNDLKISLTCVKLICNPNFYSPLSRFSLRLNWYPFPTFLKTFPTSPWPIYTFSPVYPMVSSTVVNFVKFYKTLATHIIQ